MGGGVAAERQAADDDETGPGADRAKFESDRLATRRRTTTAHQGHGRPG